MTQMMEARSSDDDTGKRSLTGYAAKFNEESVPLRDWWGDSFVEVISPGAFRTSLENNTVKALFNHNTDFVLGSTRSGTLKLEEDGIGLRFELDLPNTQVANDLYEGVKRGDIDGVSFGFKVKDDKWAETKLGDGWKTIRTLREIELIEISPTPFPAYEQTEVDCRSLEAMKAQKKNEDIELALQRLRLA
ncbi:caudovirus prohead protease [Andreesenia angusta]|uniref:Caudovirus prohead protease n=2 Tax=Andreesenia angusta TaxID=39480 RepID=A0A1S1V4E7_9FIRM|nr:caudovirus prohead protease [Andreesenia angusta]